MTDAQVPLEARDVSRRFDRRWAVRRVSARFAPGAVHVVIGHNGAGKSTLMGLLSGRMRPTQGKVLAFGHDILHHPRPREIRRRVAVLDHQPFVYPELTGLENLRFFARLYGRDASDARIRPLLERLSLHLAAGRPARTYSRGMVQRLALGRILVQGADVWLLDEPTTGLDAAGRELFREELVRARDAGCALIVVTHDPAGLSDLTDRVLTLDNGRLQEQTQ